MEYHGTDVASKLSQIHAATGRDTTSFSYVTGKIKVLKKCLNGKEKLSFLNIIGFHAELQAPQLKMLKRLKKFFQTVYYCGKEEEILTETRVCLYKQRKTKTSQSLPPEEKSMLQAIKCIHFQVYYSSRVDKTIISDILLQDNGWIVDNENAEVGPLWFTGALLI